MQQTQSLEIKTDPCETCLRFPECFGVDKSFCPLCTDHHGDVYQINSDGTLGHKIGTASILRGVLKNG